MNWIILATLILLSAAVIAAWAGSASVFINYPSISPNGDGVKDEMIILVDLSTPVDTLIVTIEDETTPSVYDTLLWSAPADSGEHATLWDGTDWTGALLPEGRYDLRVYESTSATGESLIRTVVIDTTSPQVNIDRIEPGVFSVGWPDTSASVTVYFSVYGWETGAAARITVRDPLGVEWTDPIDVQGDGEWSGTWHPESARNGFHTISITVNDEAGNYQADSGSVYVDSDGPEVDILTKIPSFTTEVPLEIIGTAFDRSGIGVLDLTWTGPDNDESYSFPPDSTWFSADTLYWKFDTPDSINGNTGHVEGGYRLKVIAEDPFTNRTTDQITFTLDITPPSVPFIQDPPPKMIHPELDLYITYDEDTDSIYVYNLNGGSIDSTRFITIAVPVSSPKTVTISEGLNEMWAIAFDKAGNESGTSNTVVSTLDPSTGITYPEVFRGPGRFQVVTPQTSSSVTIEIYDMRGERIRRIYLPGPGTSFDAEWDLTNDDGERVRNGPCVVVITIDSSTGRTVEKAFIAVVR